jgi:thiamine transport system ATP-binding protein
VGLPAEEFGQRAITALSGGEQQRVALARALAPEPRLLLLDEPFGSLDAVLRGRLVDDVRELTRSLGTTVVTVTHDRAEAFAFADRVAVMDAGRVVQCATPEELWRAPGSALVARLVGLAVLDASLVGATSAGAVAVRPSGLRVVDPALPRTALPPGSRVLAGIVEERAPWGDVVRLTILLEGHADPDRRRLPVDVAPDSALTRGAPVEVVVAPEALVPMPVSDD